MGAGLPSGDDGRVAVLYPARRVMAVCGDGFVMNSHELETAVRLD